MLPKMIYGANIAKQPQTAFGGLDMRLSSGNGLIRHMSNLTGDYAPVLATRRERWKVATLEKPNGLFAAGKLFHTGTRAAALMMIMFHFIRL